jgi:hypothetical protein
VTLINYSFTQEQDSVFISETHRVAVASGTADAMAAAALATVGVAIGSTKHSSTVKCYSRTVRPVEGVTWDVELGYRTEQFDDLITSAASGTIIDKGFESFSERVLRDRHPTSGSAYQMNYYYAHWSVFQPMAQAWWERVHDAYPHSAVISLVGAINAVTWNGYAPALWRCNAARTQTVRTDSGSRYLTRYEFTYSANGHNLAHRRYEWNNRTIASITAATLATSLFVLYKSTNFPTAFTL